MKNKIVSIMMKILIILVAIAVIVLTVFVYSNAKQKETSKTDKVEEEIDYLETKITGLINHLNEIHLENYRIGISKVQEEEGESKANTNEEKSNEKSEEEQDEGDTSEQAKTITKMEREIIFEGTKEINWEWIQGQAEVLYSVWPVAVLDLYDVGIKGEKITEFSNTMDKALLSIKEKNKLESCQNLAKLYSLLPEFIDNTEVEDLKKDVIKSKANIIKAYGYVEAGNFEAVNEEVVSAEKIFTELINELGKKEDQRKYTVNKTYILIQELKNSLKAKDKEIFYIKYKNLLQELNALI